MTFDTQDKPSYFGWYVLGTIVIIIGIVAFLFRGFFFKKAEAPTPFSLITLTSGDKFVGKITEKGEFFHITELKLSDGSSTSTDMNLNKGSIYIYENLK